MPALNGRCLGIEEKKRRATLIFAWAGVRIPLDKKIGDAFSTGVTAARSWRRPQEERAEPSVVSASLRPRVDIDAGNLVGVVFLPGVEMILDLVG